MIYIYLEDFSAIGGGSGRVTEEDKIRRIEPKNRGREGLNLSPPLPHGGWTEAVKEKHHGSVVVAPMV